MTKPNKIDLNRNYAHHAPPNQDTIDAHEEVRAECKVLAAILLDLVPDGREKSLALTKLEEVMFWANAGVARDNYQVPVGTHST
jgi:hypothetical protein